MAAASKSDDTPSASTDAKKSRRPRAAASSRKPKGEKAAKPARRSKAAEDTAAAPVAAAEVTTRVERAAPAPAAEERPVFSPAPAPVVELPPAPVVAEAPAAPSSAPEGTRFEDDRRGGDDARPSPQSGQAQGQGQGGGRPEWQGNQQFGGNDRGFWKHGKRKRGRHGGWQPGGGGGGPGREAHPSQLPPPSAPVSYGDLPNPDRFADLAALDTLATEVSRGSGEAIWLHEIYAKNLGELTAFARTLGLKLEGVPNRRQLLTEAFRFVEREQRTLRDRGYIDQNDRGYFIVHTHVNYRLYPEDAYLPESLVKRYGLKRGHRVEVTLSVPREGERCPSVVRIDSVMGLAPAEIGNLTPFEELVPYYPLKRILLENSEIHPKDVSMRAIDILTPIGFGQRGLIVAPPRTGKTVLLQNIANSISANSPDVKLILLLIDERPEEVTDFKRHTKGEVVSSTFDETPESHVHCAEMVIEICRRRVEMGEHVVVLLDSITRLARAYNALTGNQGKTMSGGLESNALQKPKRFFGSARNIEGGGSLTIIASALIDTGSRMDEIIFEEFKGTGNSELHLDRGLVERRIFPAINIDRSGTRKEELIYHPDELQRIYALRRAMQGLGPIESMEMLITRLRKTRSNPEFLLSLAPK
jgi:transcription termination factor Rho